MIHPMPAAVKKCRVCGKEYEACRSAKRIDGVFRWQEVACSPECGSIYLRMVNAARAGVDAPNGTTEYKGPRKSQSDDLSLMRQHKAAKRGSEDESANDSLTASDDVAE